jgi:hypothetical protein
VELAIPQDMQRKPGVVLIRNPMTKSDKHPLNSGVAGKFSYRFFAVSRRRAATINQPYQSQTQRRKQ